MIKFVLMVNKQGQTRLAEYYDFLSIEERVALEAEIIRKCLSRNELQCSFMEYRGMKVVYRRYASLFFIVGVKQGGEVGRASRYLATRSWLVCSRWTTTQNELGILEFIHVLVETLDKYFENVVRAWESLVVVACYRGLAQGGWVASSQCELDIMFNLEKAHFILSTLHHVCEWRRYVPSVRAVY